jgi:hypothetical protein
MGVPRPPWRTDRAQWQVYAPFPDRRVPSTDLALDQGTIEQDCESRTCELCDDKTDDIR